MNNIDRIIAYVIAGIMVITLFTGMRQETPQIIVEQPAQLTQANTEQSSIDKFVDIMMLQMLSDMQKPAQDTQLGGVYSNIIKDFSEGISVDGTVVIDGSGNIDAPITSTTGTFSSTLGVTGASTFTGDVTMATSTATNALSIGTTTPLAIFHIESTTASSTELITSGGAGGGRIILEDSDGAGCSEISILDGTIITETITCPTGI